MTDVKYQEFMSSMSSQGYDMQEIGELWQQVKDGEKSAEELMQSEGSESVEEDASEDDTDDADSGDDSQDTDSSEDTSGEDVIGFGDAINSSSSESVSDDDSSESSDVSESEGSVSESDTGSDVGVSKGSEATQRMGESINSVWAGIATSDLDRDNDERDELKSEIQKIAEDAEFGQNFMWYLEEEVMTKDETSPKDALMFSGFMVLLGTVSVRPEIIEKVKNGFKDDSKTGTVEDGEDEE